MDEVPLLRYGILYELIFEYNTILSTNNKEVTLDQAIKYLFICDLKYKPPKNMKTSLLTNLSSYVSLP